MQTRPRHRRRAPLALAVALLLCGCASGPFARRVSREEAFANCVESTPSDSVMYADEFAACMERQGWAYGAAPARKAPSSSG